MTPDQLKSLRAGGNGKSWKHGHTHRDPVTGRPVRSPTYSVWSGMIARCNRPSCTSYSEYGAQGITVCERWLDFRNFLVDMGERPAGLTLDRIDSAGNYEPSNCRWATVTEQVRNRRVVKLTEERVSELREKYKNGDVSQSQLAREYGLSQSTVSNIIHHRKWK